MDAVESPDAVIRLWSARELRMRLPEDLLPDLLLRLSNDRFMPVRREALYGFVERLPEAAQEYLPTALLDAHKSMREAARFYLSKSGWTDFAGFYVSQLQNTDDSSRAAVISGLGEIGKRQDAGRLKLFLQEASARVRRAAVRAVGYLDHDGFGEELLRAMEDERPSVARAARDALATRAHLLQPQRLWSIFEHAKRPHSRRLAVSLIGRLRWWDSAPLLVLATGCGDDTTSTLAISLLERWRRNIGRLITSPTDGQLRLLQEAIRLNREHLAQAIATDLDAHVKLATHASSRPCA